MSLVMILFSCTSDYHSLDGEDANDLYEDATSPPPGDNSGNSSNDDGTNDPAPNSAEDPDAGYVTYYRDVEPILKQLCVSCHNATLHEDGVDLSTYMLAKSNVDDIR